MSLDEKPASGDALATTVLKATAKWLVGASAATAAVVVAGLQLASLEKLGEADWWVGLLALAAALLALVAVFWVLYRAVSVLAVVRVPIGTLEKRDLEDHGNPHGPRVEDPEDPLMKHLFERRTELLGPGRDAIARLVDDYVRVGDALAKGRAVTVLGRSYDPNASVDATLLREFPIELERRIREVSDAAERFETERRFKQLKHDFSWAAVVFVLGVLAFAWLTVVYPQRILEVAKLTAPVQVEISVPSEEAAMRAGLERGCTRKILSGVAVGGTLDAPVVVTRAQEGCPARRVTDTDGLIVVPVATK